MPNNKKLSKSQMLQQKLNQRTQQEIDENTREFFQFYHERKSQIRAMQQELNDGLKSFKDNGLLSNDEVNQFKKQYNMSDIDLDWFFKNHSMINKIKRSS